MKYLRKLGESYPYDYENPPICKAELWNFSRANENEESKKEAVTTVASISHGNEYAKNPDRLWNLLIKRDEESPFEFVRFYERREGECSLRNKNFLTKDHSTLFTLDDIFATFKLKVPIFVARQIQRHRAFSYMEMSRRYVKNNKVRFEYWDKYGDPTLTMRNCSFYSITEYAEDVYEHVMFHKEATPEQARAFLPLGLYTQFWMQGNYEAFANFFIYRLAPEAQEETRLVALAMWNLLKKHQPEIIETIKDFLDRWINKCNPMFQPAREKKAEWFKEKWLGGVNE